MENIKQTLPLTEEAKRELEHEIISSMDEIELIKTVLDISLVPMIDNLSSLILDYNLYAGDITAITDYNKRFRVGRKILKISLAFELENP